VTYVGYLAFAVLLLGSVMLHEAGHFLTARRFGMKATQFFVGFGPTLFSRTRGETEYGVKAIPAGGYVKIVGMTSLEEVEPGDEDRAFYKQGVGRRTVVLAAGSTVHFLICVVLVFLITVTVGKVDDTAPVLSTPQKCLPTSQQLLGAAPADPTSLLPDAKGACPGGTVPGVAYAAGLRNDDRVLSANGRPVATFMDLTAAIRAHAGTLLHLVVLRSGQRRAVTLTPASVQRQDLQDGHKSVTVGAVGVGPGLVTKHLGPVASVRQTGTILGQLVTGTYETVAHKLGTISGIYGPHRDPTGVVGVVGAGRVSGEILGAPVPLSIRVADLLLLIAGLNLFVGVFNLLPLLPLDGGHIAVNWFEAARDRIRRLRGYTGEVQRVDLNKLTPLTLAVVAVFIVFTVFVLGADIVNPIKLGG